MDDLISRKAAIALCDWYEHEYSEVEIYFQKFNEELKELPSAQPEIVRCKDCKHGSPNGRYGCTVYHYRRYETHDMKPDDFCSRAERRTDE